MGLFGMGWCCCAVVLWGGVGNRYSGSIVPGPSMWVVNVTSTAAKVCAYVCACMCVCAIIARCACVYLHVCVCVCVCVWLNVCVCVCACL